MHPASRSNIRQLVKIPVRVRQPANKMPSTEVRQPIKMPVVEPIEFTCEEPYGVPITVVPTDTRGNVLDRGGGGVGMGLLVSICC